MEPSLVGAEVSDEASESGSEVSYLVGFRLEVWVLRWAPQKGDRSDIHGALVLVWVEGHPTICWIHPHILAVASRSTCRPIIYYLCLWPWHG